MAHATAITLAASAARTATGSGSAVDLASATTADLRLLVSAVAGTSPTLDVSVQTSDDGATWQTLGSATRMVATGSQPLRLSGALRYVRAAWTIGGTSPSFTFSLSGSALVVYAAPADLDRLGVAALANEDFTNEDKDRALASATTEADGYLNARYTLPLTAWGDDLRQHVVNIAAYRLLVRRGWSPVAPEDQTLRTGHADAMAWLQKVKDERISPPGIVDSTPDVYDAGGFVVSKAKRGW
jgi:phage gp36-like protein